MVILLKRFGRLAERNTSFSLGETALSVVPLPAISSCIRREVLARLYGGVMDWERPTVLVPSALFHTSRRHIVR